MNPTRMLPLLLMLSMARVGGAEDPKDIQDVAMDGSLKDGKARITIEGWLGATSSREKGLFSANLNHLVRIGREGAHQSISGTIQFLQGTPSELAFTLTGEGEIKAVDCEPLRDWSIRQETNGTRTLLLRLRKLDTTDVAVPITITAVREFRELPASYRPLALATAMPALLSGVIAIHTDPIYRPEAPEATGLIPLDPKHIPEDLRVPKYENGEVLAYRLQGTAYSLPLVLSLADPELRRVVLRDFKLAGRFDGQSAAFALTARAIVRQPSGGTLALLAGKVALSELDAHPDYHLKLDGDRYLLVFERAGDFPIDLRFKAAVEVGAEGLKGWKTVAFFVAPASLQPLTLEGLAADTQFDFANAARPEFSGSTFQTFLPADGNVRLAWKETPAETEGKLFFSAEMLSQVGVSPGLMRQVALLQFKVMQGEMSQVTLELSGDAEITRVQGEQVLSWKEETVPGGKERRLNVRLNQPVKDQFSLLVQMQTPLGAFPLAAEAARIRPLEATRFAGYIRVVNQGAVRLEVSRSPGLLQISPEQFPESDATRALLAAAGGQRFVYRFSGPDFGLALNADQISPELLVSQVLAYHLGENEVAAEAEFELDIREAPLRELLLKIPSGYAVARLNAPGMADYFVLPASDGQSELRLVYAQPVAGRQVFQLRLERNQSLAQTNWALPRIEVLKAKATRGHLAATADPGLRLLAERTENLTEIATAFFPRKIAGIQSAFRLNRPDWQALFRIERLPQTIQADVLHLFSISEGIAYGSSLMNFVVSGAPISTFNVALSSEYFNVEFSGKDVRNWQKTTNGYTVQLHTPVSGAYTLLASYERPFKSQGETLTFTGARPLDAHTEQGHTLITSAYQFQVAPARVSSGLLPLETGEVPPEYRLFFDAPVLAAYRYTARPFDLALTLSPLEQGQSLSQVVDRAALTTRISKEGQVLTEVRYFVKNSGHPHLRLKLPPQTELWSATVNGNPAVPVADKTDNLIPLPQTADPNALLTVELKLASRSPNSGRIRIIAPAPEPPVLLAEWKLEPEQGRRLLYRGGSLRPASGEINDSGFSQLTGLLTRPEGRPWVTLAAALGLTLVATRLWVWTAKHARQRSDFRFITGLLVGLIGFILAGTAFTSLAALAAFHRVVPEAALTFLAPVQQGGAAAVIDVLNVPEKPGFWRLAGAAWPAVLALVLWVYAASRPANAGAFKFLGWLLVCWAALRLPNGLPYLVLVLAAFILVQLIIPGLRRLWQVPRGAPTETGAETAVPPATALLVGGLLVSAAGSALAAEEARAVPGLRVPPVAEVVSQDIRVEDKFAVSTVNIRWQALQGQVLPVLYEPAVLTSASYPTGALKLIHAPWENRRAHQFLAETNGTFDIRMRFQVQTTRREQDNGVILPVPPGLINRVRLTVAGLDVEVFSPHAVSSQRELAGSNTVAQLSLAPARDVFLGWRPRSRDTQHETAVFYVDFQHLYVPAAGLVEGAHFAAIRPAQGQLNELVLHIPEGMTITDVIDAVSSNQSEPAGRRPSTWRFDPDQRKLRVSFAAPQSRPFGFLVRSQLPAGPLPFERKLGLITVEGAAGEVGSVGIGAGPDTQLDNVQAQQFSPINLEDFPADTVEVLKAQIPSIAVRRAFRYSAPGGFAEIKASAVEPDVRVETQSTLSLGEDRTTLAVAANVTIARAGIFRLSFAMPAGFDVDTISGEALSHWTESAAETNRVITLHLKAKSEGLQVFNLTLAGPGIKSAGEYAVPRFEFREAGKHTGSLLLVPEQGMRLQVTTREGLTQLDPQRSGVQQKGVLAFRVLQSGWSLGLQIEQVNSWVQVTGLQHIEVTEAMLKAAVNFQYQIENTGLKSLIVQVPETAESVRFQGDLITDFVQATNPPANGLRAWEVKLQRRVLGAYLLRLTYNLRLPNSAVNASVRGVQAADANLQRGFVTVQAAGRLQLQPGTVPPALQAADWQSIPRPLRESLGASGVNFAFRLVEPAFELPLALVRHEAAKLLPARVNSVLLNSVVSDNGAMLTHALLEIVPGDKRLLSLALPSDAHFWFAFVNRNGVWPWKEQNRILIPLEQQSRGTQPIPVEIFYTSPAGRAGDSTLDLQLLAPKFDLPLEQVTWKISLSEKWDVRRWTGAFQYQGQAVSQPAAPEVQLYLQNESAAQVQRTREAEQMLAEANNALQAGNQQQAKQAFQAAYGLSTHDAAFNEDARVQLHNMKMQQAMIGLNVRQATSAGDSLGGRLDQLRRGKEVNYTQQQARDILDSGRAEDTAAFNRLAERLVQQQDAAISGPSAIRATVPVQAKVVTFTRAVVVDPNADLRIGLKASTPSPASFGNRVLVGLGLLALLGALWGLHRSVRNTESGGVPAMPPANG